MIVFSSTLRAARRPRRIPSLASVVRALGSVRVTEEPSRHDEPLLDRPDGSDGHGPRADRP